MKNGRSLMELAQELERQRNAKRDYLLDTRNLEMGFVEAGAYQMMMRNDSKNVSTLLGVGEIAHRQIGSALGIPAKYYDKMRAENPELLAQNVNSWFTMTPQKRMVRTLDGNARAFLSERYRRIDNAEIAEAVLPILAEMPDVRIESCEITESKMYLKAVNPRLTAEIVPGDIVQSGILITNSEVGMGSMSIQPLVYRLVCTNGMVVNDARTRKYHVGRGNEAAEDYTLYSSETLAADDRALRLKVRDTVRAVVDQTRFERVIEMMREAKEAKITSTDIPQMVELAAGGKRSAGSSDSRRRFVLVWLIQCHYASGTGCRKLRPLDGDGEHRLYGVGDEQERLAAPQCGGSGRLTNKKQADLAARRGDGRNL